MSIYDYDDENICAMCHNKNMIDNQEGIHCLSCHILYTRCEQCHDIADFVACCMPNEGQHGNLILVEKSLMSELIKEYSKKHWHFNNIKEEENWEVYVNPSSHHSTKCMDEGGYNDHYGYHCVYIWYCQKCKKIFQTHPD